jgi:carboxyl-terminal processing protease
LSSPSTTRRELWLERSPAFGCKTRGGATGFQAAKIDGPDLRVVNVIPGAPAAAAGLRSGDVITEIDGIPSAAVGLAEMADLAHRPDGTVVRLRVLREGSEQIVVLTLRELVP